MHPVLSGIWTITLAGLYVAGWVIRVWSIFIVPLNRRPSSALRWLLVMMAFPWFGFILFKLIGSTKLPAKRQQDQYIADQLIRDAVTTAAKDPKLKPLLQPAVPVPYRAFEKLSHNLGGLPAFTSNTIELIPNYPDVFKRLKADIDAATQFVHLEFYIIAWDLPTELVLLALGQAVKRGVKVRLLFDQFGSKKYPGHATLVSRLEALGAEVHPMLPVHFRRHDFTRPDLRNHRKIGVIDGNIAYTGSLNLINRTYHRKDDIYYDELVARSTGPVVPQFEAVFLTDWAAEANEMLTADMHPEIQLSPRATGRTLAQVVPSGPAFETENNLKLFAALIHSAATTVTIVNPYFVPDESLLVAITSAANRGVRVCMINSAVSDQFLVSNSQRSYYDQLLAAGVEIYLYNQPILLHTKTITIDDQVAIIGSSNFDMRSFTLNLEVTLIAYDPEVVASLQTIEQTYLSRSAQVTAKDWHQRTTRARVLENIARLTSAVQ
ncbi:cardiolipin synthase [Candidatus Saccharibacteria bacterium]|nr:cardiolipin synthase [Candidatus Saccharibacteria bacterium]